MKQTAIEWLIDHLKDYGFDLSLHEFEIEQAKKMHKQEIVDAWKDNRDMVFYDEDGDTLNELNLIELAEQYYQETFISKGSGEIELSKQETLYTEKKIRETMFEVLDIQNKEYATLVVDRFIQSLKH